MSEIEQTITNLLIFSSTVEPEDGVIITHLPWITSATYKIGGATGLVKPDQIQTCKENQDAYFIYDKNKISIIIGCDGHGLNGKLFSNFTVNELSKIIIEKIEAIRDEPTLLYDIFEKFNSILSSKFGSITNGGTTCTVLIKFIDKQITANLADFDAITYIESDPLNIIFIRDGIQQPIISNVIMLSEEHSPHSLSEVSRILDMGCDIKYDTVDGSPKINAYNISEKDSVKIIERVSPKKQKGSYYMNVSHDYAMFVEHETYNFNLTRSFGDFGCKFMSAKPSISIVSYPIGTQTRTIIGSDGYFNCFTISELHQQLLLKPSQICSNGYDAVGRLFGHDTGDNTTIIILS